MTITEFDASTSSPRHGFPVAEYNPLRRRHGAVA
jgi:hypothetical protein